MTNALPIVFLMGIIFMVFGIYIFTVNPNGPSFFPIGPLIAENNNTLIQQKSGIDFNLSLDYMMGVASIMAGGFFIGVPILRYLVLPIYEKTRVKEREKRE